MACICQRLQPSINGLSSLDSFSTVREQCPALSQVFVPDSIWPKFRKWHLNPDVVAEHGSMFLLALERGQLARFTSCAHRYLLKSDRLNPKVRKQYVKDLREQWMNYNDPRERHQKFKIFSGRYVELRCAEWLEERGWTVTDLEAFQTGPDIVAKTMRGGTTAFEVKFIGQDLPGFDTVVKSISGQSEAMMPSPYFAANYLLYRAYEAAKQFQLAGNESRIAVIVVDGVTWFTFERQLKDGWIDWKNPAFVMDSDPFIEAERKKNSNLDGELKAIIGSISSVWIVTRYAANSYTLQFEFCL